MPSCLSSSDLRASRYARAGLPETLEDLVAAGDAHVNDENLLKASLHNAPDHTYGMLGFRGFAGTLTAEEVESLQEMNVVEYIEEDGRMHTTALVNQENATWGLARISNRKPRSTIYTYDDSAGEGTCAYIIDTGIETTHPEFEGRATFLFDLSEDNNMIDGLSHGTHTAGTVGSKTYGVAKKTKLFTVKVLDSYGDGYVSDIIAGFQYAARHKQNNMAECPKGSVANISLGGIRMKVINDAVAALVRAGVFVAVSAGNAGTYAEDFSPASEPSVCTVGAVHSNDTIAWWSNFGELVDILAPGVEVTSTFLNGTTATYNGTSMAAPHVAGIGAYLLGLGNDVSTLCELIQTMATVDVVQGLTNDTANLSAYNGWDTK
ncbi:oryzin precursor [Setomelanomma holmii]|uniref:Oryzin n=1 Tax=Setomelanomma holmii TaxID=210430 RepID=A0A9P4HNM8_9PLEO|nr:oryzin precursor [Setomelanomma holmii]